MKGKFVQGELFPTYALMHVAMPPVEEVAPAVVVRKKRKRIDEVFKAQSRRKKR